MNACDATPPLKRTYRRPEQSEPLPLIEAPAWLGLVAELRTLQVAVQVVSAWALSLVEQQSLAAPRVAAQVVPPWVLPLAEPVLPWRPLKGPALLPRPRHH